MIAKLRLAFGLVLLIASATVFAGADEKAGLGANLGGQAAADALKAFASSDGAFLAAEQLKETYKKDNLASILKYPTDEITVLNLTGAQIKQAFERSVSLYPESNSSFLQISGFEVTFKKSAAPNSRIVSVTVNGAKLEDGKTYTVAMPSLLGHGALGYFKIWEKAKPTKNPPKGTLESVLKDKKYAETSPRWSSQD